MQIHEWHVHGLPKDTHSIENSTIIMKCDKWPLIIDPEEQATKFVLEVHFKSGFALSLFQMAQKLSKRLGSYRNFILKFTYSEDN